MSHFLMGVVVPKSWNEENEGVQDYIQEAMEDFDEGLEVEPYIRQIKEEVQKEYEKYCEDKTIPLADWWYDWNGCRLDKDGNSLSTYNPKSKWDWYRVGGRWDGDIQGKTVESTDNGFNFDDGHESLKNNMTTVKDLIELIKKDEQHAPFGILTSAKEWIERGEMGWWGVVSNEKEKNTWTEQVIKVLEAENADDFVVGVDCHI